MPDTALPGEIIGYRKNGTPIRLLAGGAPEDPENDPATDPGQPSNGTSRFYSQEEFDTERERVRQEERNKLYPRINKSDERTQAMEAELKELRAFQKKQEKAEADRLAQIEAERKKAAEAKLTAEQLIAKREEDFNARMEQFQRDQEVKIALLEKQNEMVALQAYIQRRVNEEQDNIAPELLDYVGGETPEQVEASIAKVKASTASIVENMKAAGVRQRAAMPGVAPSAGTNGVGPMDQTGNREYTADDIKNMGMGEFAELRRRIGMATSNNQGLFRQ